MTTIQKKSDLAGQSNPIAHLTEADIEQIGIELDAIRVKGAFPGPTAWRPPIV